MPDNKWAGGIQVNGVDVPVQPKINFTGGIITSIMDDPDNLRTNINLSGGGPTNSSLFTGPQKDGGATYDDDGAIDIVAGVAVLTKVTAQNMTLAAPVAGDDDYKTLRIQSQTAAAHAVVTPANIVNGANDTITFGGAIGDNIVLMAFQGQWLKQSSTNITLT